MTSSTGERGGGRVRRWVLVLAALVGLGALVAVFTGGSGDDESGSSSPATSSTAPSSTTTTRPTRLTAGPVADWGGAEAKVVCTTIDQQVPQVPGFAYPVADWLQRLLGPVGITVVGADQPCDATLDVTLYLEGRPGEYDAGGGQSVTYYSGMLRRFDLTLTAPGRAPVAFSNTTDTEPGEVTLSSDPRTPQEFAEKWAGVFRAFTIQGLVRVWGAPVGIEALRDGELAFDADQVLRDLSGLGRPGTPPAPSGYDGWRDWYEGATVSG
jgi:hypothetical protein